jgi:SAM-dependent methyltransferase
MTKPRGGKKWETRLAEQPLRDRTYAIALQVYRHYRLFSSPERVRMRSTVRRWIQHCPDGARVLEVGGGTSMMRRMIERDVPGALYMSGDIAPTDRTTIVLDALALPIRDASVDAVLALEVLEHMPHPQQMLVEVSRVLTEDGMLLLSTPFMFGVHDFRDYFRYTKLGLSELLVNCDLTITEVVLRGGTFVSSAGLLRNLMRDAIVGDPADWRARGRHRKARWAAATVIMVPWVPVMWLAFGIDRLIDRQSKSPPGYFFLCRKVSEVSR